MGSEGNRTAVAVATMVAVCLGVLVFTAGAEAAKAGRCEAGAAGIGDPYYPGYGNGGYDVGHYDLDLAYDAASDTLRGSCSGRHGFAGDGGRKSLQPQPRPARV